METTFQAACARLVDLDLEARSGRLAREWQERALLCERIVRALGVDDPGEERAVVVERGENGSSCYALLVTEGVVQVRRLVTPDPHTGDQVNDCFWF